MRGLAYYTGIVFEVFDRVGKFRAIAGGGRYDNSNRATQRWRRLNAGPRFRHGGRRARRIDERNTRMRVRNWRLQSRLDRKIDIYVVIAKEQRRADALAQIQQLRDRGYRVDYPLTSEKVGKQFQTAEQLGARVAVLFGDEWPQVKVKNLATREQNLQFTTRS